VKFLHLSRRSGGSVAATLRDKLRHRAGPRQARLHDLRRTVATRMAEDLQIKPHVVEEILNHVSYKSGVAKRYNKAATRPTSGKRSGSRSSLVTPR
jgi:integrase